jgi:hypothetical protein
VTQGTNAQNQPYVQIQPQSPRAGWNPEQIVEGFLTASANFGNYPQVARQYLTPAEATAWNPSWSAVVYKNGPNPKAPSYSPTAKNATTATVAIGGTRQAVLQGYGSYSLPSSSTPDQSYRLQPSFSLVKMGGQWRISSAPDELLLTSDSFANDYQLHNLYFFDPTYRYLVPDPIYVPVRASPGDLMNGLVSDLIKPFNDWLTSGATKSAFPPGTKISDVTLNGVTAVVNLTGAISKASDNVMQLVSAQLLWTLTGGGQSEASGQQAQSIEVEVNGKVWTPLDSQGNPVNPVQASSKKTPALGASTAYYYVDSSGNLTSSSAGGKPVVIAKIGTRFTQIAVSRDGNYVAALAGTTLYTGLTRGPLTRRGSGYVAISWDVNDNLWASAGTQIVMFRASSARQPLGQMASVDVVEDSLKNLSVPFTALQVAPDGVRVAIVIGSAELTFGAISGEQGASPQISLSSAQLSPLNPADAFTGLTWYGPDDVITLATGPELAVTDYPVSGGTATPIPVETGMKSISASYGQPLIAGMPKGQMVADASTSGSWMGTNTVGATPVYPG